MYLFLQEIKPTPTIGVSIESSQSIGIILPRAVIRTVDSELQQFQQFLARECKIIRQNEFGNLRTSLKVQCMIS